MISVSILTLLFGIAVPSVAYAWSNWQNVSRLIHMPGGTSVSANGTWRHRTTCIDHHCTVRAVQAETHSTGFRSVAISNGHLVIASRVGQIAHASTTRRLSGNTVGWDIVR